MTEIRIKRLVLRNFKCHSYLRLDLLGGNAAVYGDNATGKTSIYDALTWLLFAKDSQGNGEKNVEIKPLNAAGEVQDHNALTEVEAILDVNGTETSLRRTYKEVWTTKRGSSQATYNGNTSEYYVDGVPCKRNAFQEKVNELVSEDTFRLLTSVTHFANGISWQERRGVLFQVAGVMDDKQIMATNEQFFPLLDSLGKLNLEDYRKKMLAEKRKFVGAKTEIPARISECQKTIEDVQGLDFAAAKAEADALLVRQDSLSAQIMALEHDSAAEQKRMEIREAKAELGKLEAENKAYRDSQQTGIADIHSMSIRVTAIKTQMERKGKTNQAEAQYIQDLEKKIAESREQWILVNGETFGGGSCPTCGQVLPEKQFRAAAERFEAGKKSRLYEIEKTANAYKESKAQAEERLGNGQMEVLAMNEEMKALQVRIEEVEASHTEPRDMDGFAVNRDALANRIDTLSCELADMMDQTGDVLERLRDERTEVAAQIAEKMTVVNKESLLKYANQRIDALRQDARTAAECLDGIEKMLFLMDEYSRYKTGFVEDSINGLFRIARFRLFREQANCGVEDRCDVVYAGIPYVNINNGMKINVGIDIINTLSKAYGVRVPLFVDNAESVTKLEKCASQIIRLIVSEQDKELRVQYEN